MSERPVSQTFEQQLREVVTSVFVGESRFAWRTVAAAIFALPPLPGEQELFERCTGRARWPTSPAREAWLIVGRRGGKSEFTGRVAAVLSNFRDYRGVLARGERGVGMIIASDRRQARVVKGYCAALCHALPGKRVKAETKDAIELINNVTVEIHTRSIRAPRGYTVVFAVAEELAFWDTEDAANPDSEVLNALRPAMSTVHDALLMCISSPYARRGELWKAYQAHYGKDGDVFVWKADTRTMNPLVPQRVIDRAYEADEAVASAEYGAEFRRDVETFIAREAIDAAVVRGRLELPPVAA